MHTAVGPCYEWLYLYCIEDIKSEILLLTYVERIALGDFKHKFMLKFMLKDF